MKCVSLNGSWLYRIGFGKLQGISVPFSRTPVGRSECIRHFDLPDGYERLFLKFDGITYFAKVTLNGTEIGQMLPYCEYEFEITHLAMSHGNELKVELEDLDRAFGPSEGWENFGGIIRDVSLIFREKNYIKSVFFKPTLSPDLKSAKIAVDTELDLPTKGDIQVELSYKGEPILSYSYPAESPVCGDISEPRLWSPDCPELYEIKVSLLCGGKVIDEQICSVGFKSFTCDRHRFILNGKPLFLKGVCKHEMVGDSGHCPTYEQMESDMRIIKNMGCNFVRLVHYPHNKKILDIADRIGLLVCEEPGLWWSDTSNSEIAEGSKEVLRRTVIRDRNHPSVAFWLCFNECIFTESYLSESAEICRKYDPTRMVSGANCMSDEETLLHYNRCGFDFYTMHPYSNTFDRARESARLLSDKPLLFSEWGGYFVYDNPHLLLDFMTEMHSLYQNASDSGALAGAIFWFFAELNDYNRGEPACVDGILREGLVDKYRNKTMIYDAFCQGLALFDSKESPLRHKFWLEDSGAIDKLSSLHPLTAQSDSSSDLILDTMRKEAEKRGVMRKRVITNGPVLRSASPLAEVPWAVTPRTPLVFKCGIATSSLCVAGLTALSGGYPLGGAYGEEVCEMTVTYESGKAQVIPLKNGVHFTTVYALNASSRIDPIAEDSQRLATFGYNKNFEIYVINRLDVKTESQENIESVSFRAYSEKYLPLIYGVFAKDI